jgi:hypothetical protein
MPPPRRATPEPPDPALARMTSQPTLPVMLPEASLFDEDLPVQPLPETGRIRLGAVTMVLLGVGAVAAGLWWWNHRGTIEAPSSLSGVFSSHSASAPPVPRDTTIYAPNDTASMGGGSMAASPPMPVLPDTTAVSNPAAGRTPAGATTSPPTAAAPPAAQPAPNVTAGVPPAPVVTGPPPVSSDARVRKFDALADSLEQAIRNFQDRDADFTMKRLTCRGLGVGYQSADDAYIALARAYGAVRATIDGTRDARFRKLSSQIGGVNNTFDASKCPRP